MDRQKRLGLVTVDSHSILGLFVILVRSISISSVRRAWNQCLIDGPKLAVNFGDQAGPVAVGLLVLAAAAELDWSGQ